MKKIIFILIIAIITSCTNSNDNSTDEAQSSSKKIKVGLALGYGGIGDQSFNDMQYNGLIEASRKLDIDITYIVPNNDTEEEMIRILEHLIEKEHVDLIITAGFLMPKPISICSKKYPNKTFVIIDDEVKDHENVVSVMYAQNEGSFLAGALAAMKTKTNKVGFLGGVNIPVVKEFLAGYKQGASYINPKIKIDIRYCSQVPDFSGFTSPKTGYAIANKMYSGGVDIIYSVAGETGNGIILAAKDNKKFAIGVDSNQDHLAKGYVLTSMMKRMDRSVIDVCEKFVNGNLKGNQTILYNIKNGGITLTEMEFTSGIVSDKDKFKLEKIKSKIINGDIKVKLK